MDLKLHQWWDWYSACIVARAARRTPEQAVADAGCTCRRCSHEQ
jgi:hypothetical protein